MVWTVETIKISEYVFVFCCEITVSTINRQRNKYKYFFAMWMWIVKIQVAVSAASVALNVLDVATKMELLFDSVQECASLIQSMGEHNTNTNNNVEKFSKLMRKVSTQKENGQL